MKPKHIAATLVALMPMTLAQAAPTLVDDFYTPDAAVFSVATPGILGNDISAAGGLVVTSIDTTGLQGTVTALTNGSFTFTPSAGLSTNTAFIYRASDLSGASSATVTFDMTSTLPVAKPESFTLTTPVLNVPATAGLLVNDTGGIGALSVFVVSKGADHGTVSVFTDGRFTYTPDSGFAGIDAFAYKVRDSLGRISEATVTIDVSTNPPVANPDSYTLTTDVLFVPAGAGLLVNDTGGIGDLAVFLITNDVDHGTLSAFADGRFFYTPDAGFAGIDTFAYRIRDAVGRTSDATVTIDASTDLPVAVSDVYDVTPDLVFNVAVPGFLANDTGGIGPLRAILISDDTDHGSLLAFPDGRFTYTPDSGFIGIDSFKYRIADDLGRSAEAAVRLLVGVEDPDPPVVTPAPEPGTLALMLAGATAAIGAARRRKAR